MKYQPVITSTHTRQTKPSMFALRAGLALLCAGGVSAAVAGQVGVQANLGVTGLASTPDPTFSGATWKDGVVNAISAPAGVFAYPVDVPAATSAAANFALDVSVSPAPQQTPVALPAWASVSADMLGGRLGAAAATSFTPVVEPSGAAVSAFTVARTGAELGLGLDLFMPWSGGAIPTLPVTLRLTLNGTILDVDNGASISLLSTLRLSNVATEPGAPLTNALEAVNSFSTSLAGHTISLTGNLLSPTCSSTYALCSWYLSVYASIEGAGQFTLPGGPTPYAWIAAGDALDFTDGARIELLVPEGAKVTDGLTGRSYGWVTSVPEPSGLALLMAGLLGVAGLRKRSQRLTSSCCAQAPR